MRKRFLKNQDGFTLIEFLVTFGILLLITGAIVRLQIDFFSANKFLRDAFSVQGDALETIETMIKEIRAASESAVGAYPIEQASELQLTFFSDIDGDSLPDRIRYFYSNGTLRKGVIKPTGTPLAYGSTTEQVSFIMNGLVASTTVPIFQYYGGSYAGTTSPLAFPVAIPAIRHVKITLTVPAPSGAATTSVYSSNVTIRTLKFRGSITN